MSRLADKLQITLDALGLSGRALEHRAGLQHMTVTGIMSGRHPRSERMARILAVLPADHAHTLLEAYLLDDCPSQWVQCVQILIAGTAPSLPDADPASSDLAEVSGTYRARPTTATQARQTLDQMRHAIDNGDTALADWLASTGRLLVTPHLPRRDEDPS